MKQVIATLLILAFLLLLPQTAFALDESIGPRLDDFYEVRKVGTAAASIAVFDDADIVVRHYGEIDREKGVSADDTTVYEWGSVTKTLVWVSLMQLEEAGEVDFAADVRDYLPEGFLTKLAYPESITLTHLMNHQAGFQENAYAPESKDASDFVSLEEALRQTEPSQIYRPGEVTAYSNWGASLAAFIVEEVTGQSFAAYVHANIFAPLGMEDTGLLPDRSDNPSVQARRAGNQSYDVMENRDKKLGPSLNYILLYPAGACAGTLGDLARFGQGLLSGRVFQKPETRERFFTPTLSYTNHELGRVAHGMWSLPVGEDVWGHGGNTAGYSASLFLDIGRGEGVAVLTNEVGETAYTYGIPEAVFGPKDFSDLEAEGRVSGLSGVYTNARMKFKRGFNRVLEYAGGVLMLGKSENGELKISLLPGELVKINPTLYLMSNENGLTKLLAFDQREGETVIEDYTADYFRRNTAVYWLKFGLFLVFLLTILISFVRLVVFGVRHLRVKPIESSVVFSVGLAILGVLVFLLVLERLATTPAIGLIFAVGIILALALMIYGVYRKQNIFDIVLLVIALVNLVYWQWIDVLSL